MDLNISNFLRVVSILAVLLIHSTYPAQEKFSTHLNWKSIDFLYVLINQFARFSVPVFIILSGYGLATKYSENLHIKEFYFKRFMRIGIPFVFWTVFLLLIGENFIINLEFFKKLFFYLTITGIDYHFYFMIIILQCYIFFPLLVRINNIFLLILLLLLQLYNYSPTDLIFTYIGIPYFSFPSTFLFSWLFYFYLGIFTKKNEDKFLNKKGLKLEIFLLLCLVITAVIVNFEYIYKSFSSRYFSFYDHFHRYSVLLYSVSVFFFFYFFDLYKFFKENHFESINKLSEVSFAVYLFHTWILRVLDSYLYLHVGLKSIALIFISFLIFIGIQKILQSLLKNQSKWISLIFGL